MSVKTNNDIDIECLAVTLMIFVIELLLAHYMNQLTSSKHKTSVCSFVGCTDYLI